MLVFHVSHHFLATKEPLLDHSSALLCNEVTDIHILHSLGKGHFGTVYLAMWKDVKVAAKKLNSEEWTDMKKEVTVLQKLNHPNIVHFYGISFYTAFLNLPSQTHTNEKEEKYIITELCSGNVSELLQKSEDITLYTKLSMYEIVWSLTC